MDEASLYAVRPGLSDRRQRDHWPLKPRLHDTTGCSTGLFNQSEWCYVDGDRDHVL